MLNFEFSKNMTESNKPSLSDFLRVHEGQLLASKIPQHFWPTIFEKLHNQILDAGDYFQIIMEESDEGNKFFTVALQDINTDDEKNIFLIDHAWTFCLNNARASLEELDSLRENLASLFGISTGSSESPASSDEEDENADKIAKNIPECSQKTQVLHEDQKKQQINNILNELWRYAQTYTMRSSSRETNESDLPVWYLPDAFGIRIGHSFTPNCRMVPFFYAFDRMAYSLLFPISNISDSDEVTRNYLDHRLFYEHPEWKNYLIHPWLPYDLSAEPAAGDILPFAYKDDAYFLSGRIVDELPETVVGTHLSECRTPNGLVARVYADDFQLIHRLKNVKVETNADLFSADIVWLRKHFYSFKELSELNPKALVNQFPFEASLTVKDLFAAIVQSVNMDKPFGTPDWFPVTFNLQMELPHFVKYFLQRENGGLDNTWIVKPWNLARGLDVHVTQNVNCVIRLAESGPKIVSKYIENPVLFERSDNANFVKFDLRYIVFLRSLRPLDIAIYDKFWTRFAVNEFDLEKLDDQLTHLTVHNYNPDVDVLNMDCADFIIKFEETYPQVKWSDIDKRIKYIIKQVFQTVSTIEPPRGMAPNSQSKAMYGLDFILHWKDDSKTDVNVSFIEANFMPDCNRACDFYPDFADTVFETLFFNRNPHNVSVL